MFTVLITATIGFGQNITIGFRDTVFSKTLNQDRELSIYLPSSYHSSPNQKYPALYILDGDYNFQYVAGLWLIWHLNFEMTLSNLFFFGILVLGSWGIGLVTDKTQSLLAIASFHSFNNFYSEWNTLNLVIIGALVLVWILAIIYLSKIEKKVISK